MTTLFLHFTVCSKHVECTLRFSHPQSKGLLTRCHISPVGLRRLPLYIKHLCISGCKDGYHGDKCSETCSPSGQCQRCDQNSGLCSACYSNLTPPSCTGRSCFWHHLHAPVGHVSYTAFMHWQVMFLTLPSCTGRSCFWHLIHAPVGHISDTAFVHR